jgi:type II secretory pathway pseudopilin PulG
MSFSVFFLIVLGVVGVLSAVVLITMLALRHEQEKLNFQRENEQRAHEQRMTMIKQGIMPPTDTPEQKEKTASNLFGALTGIAIAAVVFAWLSPWATPHAWTAAGFIGVAAIVGAVVVFLQTQSKP